MVPSAWRSHGHAEGSVIAAYTVVDRNVVTVKKAVGGVGVGLLGGRLPALAALKTVWDVPRPSHRDLPRAIRARIGEGAKGKASCSFLACRLGRRAR